MFVLRFSNLCRKTYFSLNVSRLCLSYASSEKFSTFRALTIVRCTSNIFKNYLEKSLWPKPNHISLCLSSVPEGENFKKAIEKISQKFTEAIGLLEDARSSLNTVYFSEDMDEAETLVLQILNEYDTLLSGLDPIKQTEVQRTIGLKISELKAQLKIVKDMCRE